MPSAIAAAGRRTRRMGLSSSGVNPRSLRGSQPRPHMTNRNKPVNLTGGLRCSLPAGHRQRWARLEGGW